MLTTFAVSSVDTPLKVARELISRLPKTVSDTAQLLHTVLVATAVETIKAKGYSPATTSIILFMPLEHVAKSAGVSRVTAWRHLPALKELGVVDYKVQKGNCRGESRNSGCVWSVRLTPNSGCKAAVSTSDMRFKFRDMDKDLRANKTSHALLKARLNIQSYLTKGQLDIEPLLDWTLSRRYINPAGKNLYVKGASKPDLEAILAIATVPPKLQNRAVSIAAESLAKALNDRDSTEYYAKVLHACLRGTQHAVDVFQKVYLVAVRAGADTLEGFARDGNGGKLFSSRLKKFDWYSEVMNSPPTRVGTKPIS